MAEQSPSTDRIFAAPGAGPPTVSPGGPQDSQRLVLVAIAVVVAALVWLVRLARRSSEFTPDYLAEVVLYALSAACVVMLLALGFVLARNLIKILAERRRAVPFARFRSKLVAALLGLTLIPSMLVLIVGSEVIRSSAERWFSAPIDDVLRSANAIARGVYQDQQQAAEDRAGRLAARLATVDLARLPEETLRDIVAEERAVGGGNVVDIYLIEIDEAGEAATTRLVEVADPFLPPGYPRASADALAASLAAGNVESASAEPLSDGAELLRGAAVVRAAGDGPVVGVVVASIVLSGDLTAHARRINGAFGTYNQLRVLTRPVTGVYLSFFLMTTLMILIAATWLGTYVAKRITRPVLQLAEGARQIGTGDLDHRIEPESSDEFGGMVEAFNAMAADLSTSQRKLIQSRGDLEHKTRETERRRRYIETILERIATGVISIDSAGRLTTVNAAAVRLLSLDATVIGEPAALIFERPDLAPLDAMLREARRGAFGRAAREVALARGGRECHLAVAATTLPGERGLDGVVMVFDDVTPLFRAQRVATWRDVARRLAHEIKNPLTSLRSAVETTARLKVPEQQRKLMAIIQEDVNRLDKLISDISDASRLDAELSRAETGPVNIGAMLAILVEVHDDTTESGARMHLENTAGDNGPLMVDGIESRLAQVFRNLLTNAQSFSPGEGSITITTSREYGWIVVDIDDDGPGIPAGKEESIFERFYTQRPESEKFGTHSGLGLSISRQIVDTHRGRLFAANRTGPSGEVLGARFSVRLRAG